MRDTTRKKIAPIICAVIVVGIASIFLVTVLFPLLKLAFGVGIAVGILSIYALIVFAIIVGVIFALYQRLKEIDGGEEEVAKRY